MKNKKSHFKSFLVMILVVVVLPYLMTMYFNRETNQVFYKYLQEDHEICRERFERDKIPTAICNEIRDGAKLAFSTASERGFTQIIILEALLFGFGFGIWSLKNRVNELEEKIKELDS